MPQLRIAVFSDVICPWCYLGKRRLERALDQLGIRADTRIDWLPFELNPDMPSDGMDREAYRAAKFGAQRSAELDRQMTALGREEGVSFAFDRQERTPNTRRAHMLIAHAARAGSADAVVEALFRSYFEEGREIGSPDGLIEIAVQAGLPREAASRALEDAALHDEVRGLERQAAEIGISGVPFFVIDGALAVSGAQPAASWVEVLKDVMSRKHGAGQDQPAAGG
jgi:predicted DsbA family dithiol-disulfide isomerase